MKKVFIASLTMIAMITHANAYTLCSSYVRDAKQAAATATDSQIATEVLATLVGKATKQCTTEAAALKISGLASLIKNSSQLCDEVSMELYSKSMCQLKAVDYVNYVIENYKESNGIED